MKKVSVSVIIPCFNCSETIGRCIYSVLKQTVTPEEIILIDDCSTDDTIKIIDKIKSQNIENINLVALSENNGPATARNAGWSLSSSEYIAFLDSDDTWHPQKLEIQYEFMKNNPDIDLSGHACIYKSNDQKIPFEDLIIKSMRYGLISRFFLLFKNPFSTPTIMLKKNLPYRFIDNSRYAEDIFLWQRLAFSGFKIAYLKYTLAYVHKPFYGATGISAKIWEMEKGELNNFLELRKEKSINIILYLLAVIFSLIKYSKRIFLSRFRE